MKLLSLFTLLTLLPAVLPALPEPPPVPIFEEVAAGINFLHRHGGQGRKYLIETMGSGGGFLDFDKDGWPDVYLIQSGSHSAQSRSGNQLYRNNRDGTFTLVRNSGAEDRGYGMGCTFGDYDNDGWTDIYVTNFGPNRLYRNRGDGTFEERSRQSGVDDPAWSTSASFADVDGDGDLDLYVANYLDFSYSKHIECGDKENPSYCHPDVYPAAPNSFYLNDGEGSFQKAQRGLVPQIPEASKSLGVLFFDMDDDGDQDLYVANDSTANFLFKNLGAGSFEDISALSGTAYNLDGKTEAGMGIDAADVDGDGRSDLIVTHLDFETNTLYLNEGEGFFSDWSERSGVGGPSRTRVGFGVNFADFNNDGFPDLFVANGHVIDTIEIENPSISYAQSNQLLINRGSGRFADHSQSAGAPFSREEVSRGSALADLDRDGDLDILLINNNGPARLLVNRFEQSGAPQLWIQLQLEGRHCNRNAVGARVRLKTSAGIQVREVRAASSYCSQSELPLHFGLGAAPDVEWAEIRWPCGRTQRIAKPSPGKRHRVTEPTP